MEQEGDSQRSPNDLWPFQLFCLFDVSTNRWTSASTSVSQLWGRQCKIQQRSSTRLKASWDQRSGPLPQSTLKTTRLWWSYFKLRFITWGLNPDFRRVMWHSSSLSTPTFHCFPPTLWWASLLTSNVLNGSQGSLATWSEPFHQPVMCVNISAPAWRGSTE